MRERNGIVFTILLLLLSLFHPVKAEPFDYLQNERINPYVEDALFRTMAFGDLLAETYGNEIVIGTTKGILIVMDHDLNTIFSLSLGSNAKKTTIAQIDENSREERGLFVLTEGRIIRFFNRNGTGLLSLKFQAVSDFIVINADEDNQKEIVLTNGSTIESYNLSGEKVWSFQGNSDFRKLVYLEEYGHFGGFAASTLNSIHFFSYNGSYIFDVSVPVGEIRDFLVKKPFVFVLGDRNRIFRLNIEDKKLEKIYPNELSNGNLEYISDIHSTEYGIAAIGQRGRFQILSSEGAIMAEDCLEIEIVGFDCANLDAIQGLYIPQESEDIISPELLVYTQAGRIHVYILHSGVNGYDLKLRENYEIENIKYATVFPLAEGDTLYSILAVDMEGRLHSSSIFLNFHNVLTMYSNGLRHYRDGEYHESELLLKEIVDPVNQSEKIIRNRNILRNYGLLERAETYLKKSREKLNPLIEEGKTHARKGYLAPNYEKGIEYLFLAYMKFHEADIHEEEKVYDSKTLDDIIRDIRVYILRLLETADTYYQESKYEQALHNYSIVYPKMETLMDNPLSYVEQMRLVEFEDLVERYQDIEDVRKKMMDCIDELNEISQEALRDGDLKKSRQLNNLLIETAKIIDASPSRYESRNEEISNQIESERIYLFKILAIISVFVISIFTLGLILVVSVDWKIKAISEKRDYLILSVIVSVLITLGLIGILDFLSLTPEEQIENLRYTAGSLIQGYIAALAIVPGLILALMSFFASRYPSYLTRKIWKSKEIAAFFLAIAFGLAICCFILISLSDSGLVLKMGGEVLSIAIVLSAIYLLAVRIKEIFDMKNILSRIERNIQERKNLDDSFQDLVSVIYSFVENRDVENLKRTVEDLFDLIVSDETHFEEMIEILLDICTKCKMEGKNLLCIKIEEMIRRGCEKAAKSSNSTLSDKCKEMMGEN